MSEDENTSSTKSPMNNQRVNWKKRIGWMVSGLALLPIILLRVNSFMATRPQNLGVRSGQLADCPESPNCVCTHASDAQHAIDPIPLTTEVSEAMRVMKAALLELPRTKIITETEDYLHAECTSFLFRFVDDVEVFIDEEAQLIHLRSASRVGRSDLGKNRERIEIIRKAYLAAVPDTL